MQANKMNKKLLNNVHYTLPQIAKEHVDIAYKYIFPFNLAIDPCAGANVYIDELRKRGIRGLGFDILPGRDDVSKMDLFESTWGAVPIITNPPFSRTRGIDVFNYLANHTIPYICFFWPISIKKWSRIDRLNRHYHLVDEKEYWSGKDTKWFNSNYKSDQMNMVFQVWERRKELRGLTPKPKDIISQYIIKKSPGTPEEDCKHRFVYLGFSAGQLQDVPSDATHKHNTYWYLSPDTPQWILVILGTHPWEDFYKYTQFRTSRSVSKREVNFILSIAARHTDGLS